MTTNKVKYPAFQSLKGMRIILASTSPRRIELFTRMGLDFEIFPSNFEEDYEKSLYPSPTAYSAATCLRKAQIVHEATMNDSKTPSLIVSSDTIVVCNNMIYEKPTDRQDAFRMLSELRGNTIQVITAVSIFYRTIKGMQEHCFEDITEMFMHNYNDEMINAYLDTGDGVGFSGALAYQSAAFLLVKGINGCFYNLIGFPAPRFYQEFIKISNQIVQVQ